MKKTPLYNYSRDYALKNGEMEAYRASFTANIACRDAIEKAIVDYYDGHILSQEAVNSVIKKFGIKRTEYVLAESVLEYSFDGRIRQSNKEWAQTVPIVPDYDSTATIDFNREFVVCKAHPGLLDLFVEGVRDEQRAKTPLYKYNAAYARDHGQLEKYRDSRRANTYCAKSIENAIIAGWDGMHVSSDAVKSVISKFGVERVSYVLAATIQHNDWDERCSSANRNWANTIPMYLPDESRPQISGVHMAKLNDFVSEARRQIEAMRERKPSIRGQLKEKSDAPGKSTGEATKRKRHEQER